MKGKVNKMVTGIAIENWKQNESKKNLYKSKIKKRLNLYKFLIVQNIKEFCRNTTLHGLSYLTNKDLYPMERAFFAISFITVVILAGFFIINVYNKWSTTPVILSINPQPTFITNEPFPALTICNMNQAYKTKVEKYGKNSLDHAMIQMLCKREVNVTVADAIGNWSSFNHFISNISQPCEKMLVSCRFGGIEYNCNRIFHSIITDEGLCCAFNMVHPKFMYIKGTISLINESSTNHSEVYTAVPWNAEKGYPKILPKQFYPHRAAGTGESLGLTVILDVEADEYYCSSSNSYGFKMAMHSPTETPNVREVGLLIAAGYETKARVRIDKLESDRMLHKVHLKHRQCLFQSEHNLQYFASYSQHNCETECVAKSLMRHCGCFSHFMPRKYGNGSVCSIYDIECVERTRLHSMLNDDDDNERECDEVCLPSCFDLKFYAEFFMSPLMNKGFQIANQKLREYSSQYMERNIAVLTMYYKDNSFRSSKQTEFIGMTDVLSSVGGLIGLFFGFSFISLAEIIFYTFIRPWRKDREVRPKIKSGKRRNIPSSIGMLKPPSSVSYALRSRRKWHCNPSVFRVPPKIVNIPRTINMDEYYRDRNFITCVNPKLNMFHDREQFSKRDWRYDHMY